MSGGKTILHLLTKAAIGLGALFLVGVLLAAIPNHRTPAVAPVASEAAQETEQPAAAMDDANMPEMDMADEHASEHTAMADMARCIMATGAHAHDLAPPPDAEMNNAPRRSTEKLRAGIEKYKDYHVALKEGIQDFLPHVPQAEYHFTNYANGFLEAFTFDPARPTSLLYKRTSRDTNWSARCTPCRSGRPRNSLMSECPSAMASWHLHTNLCMPPRGQMRRMDWTKFGLKGSIATQQACDAAGGDSLLSSSAGWFTFIRMSLRPIGFSRCIIAIDSG